MRIGTFFILIYGLLLAVTCEGMNNQIEMMDMNLVPVYERVPDQEKRIGYLNECDVDKYEDLYQSAEKIIQVLRRAASNGDEEYIETVLKDDKIYETLNKQNSRTKCSYTIYYAFREWCNKNKQDGISQAKFFLLVMGLLADLVFYVEIDSIYHNCWKKCQGKGLMIKPFIYFIKRVQEYNLLPALVENTYQKKILAIDDFEEIVSTLIDDEQLTKKSWNFLKALIEVGESISKALTTETRNKFFQKIF